jgi:hypothetical protein
MEASLADVSPSAAAAIGVPGFVDALGLGDCRHVVVCLIDGLGWESLQQHAADAPVLAAMSGGAISAVFPTTTPVGLGSLGTGLLPGAHGLMGAAFEIPETGELLSPLQWGDHPSPVAVQPEPTVFERVARAGVRMTTVSPGAYRESGLTRAVLRGADYVPADDIDERVAGLAGVLSTADRSFTYVYWPELDRIGHEFGVASAQWRAALRRADGLVARLLDVLVPGTTLVVTADHGMVDCPTERRIHIEANPLLTAGVRRVAGEPRARHLYVVPGAASDVQAAWQRVLGADALVLRRSELVEGGYFGDVDPGLEERIGDVMAIPRGDVMLASLVDATVSQLIGQHGGLTVDEVRIPALIHRVP